MITKMDFSLNEIVEKLNLTLPATFYTLSKELPIQVHFETNKLVFVRDGHFKPMPIYLNHFVKFLKEVDKLRSVKTSSYKNFFAVSYMLPLAFELLQLNKESIRSEISNKNSRTNNSNSKLIHFKNSKQGTKSKFHIIDVHYATNRCVGSEKEIFSGERNEAMQYGKASISIPESHKSGKLERPSYFKFDFFENDNKHFVLKSGMKLNHNEFFTDIKNTSKEERVLVFIHGYNVTFKDALFQTAQIKKDFEFIDPIALFSWPSKGEPECYVDDKEAALYSSGHLLNFLESLQQLGLKEVLVIAHSMGGFCISEALKNVTNNKHTFSHLALAAPDVEQKEFTQKYSNSLTSIFKKVSVYAASSDKALWTSRRVNGSIRLGDTSKGVTVAPNIDTIVASDKSQKWLNINHSYVFQDDSVLNDIHGFLVNNLAPAVRRLDSLLNFDNLKYWKIKG